MEHGIYVGPAEELKGKTALIRNAPYGGVLVQFDDCTLLDSAGNMLGFGWHPFRSSDFTNEQNHD